MKEMLNKILTNKKAEYADLEKRLDASSDVAEVRQIGDTLLKLKDEISEIEAKLAEAEKTEEMNKGDGGETDQRSFNPMATYNTKREDTRGSMEYRSAFMDYVQNGTVAKNLEYRDGVTSGDLGVLLPTTVIQEIIKGIEKVYGQLYSRVKKTNIKGGVKYPVGAFSATFTRIAEGAPAPEKQKGGQVTGFVEFSYRIGEIRLSQSLLANVLTVPVFETELAKVIVEAYLKAMDSEILNGEESQNQMQGILTEAKKGGSGKISTKHIIEFTEQEMADWAQWQSKLFAKIPLGMRGLAPEFVMTPHTYEANIKTLKDSNDRPLYAETYNPVDGAETATFKGKQVVFVEEGNGLNNFDDALNGEYFGIYWVPEKAYAVNTNLEFAVKRYFDEDKLEWVDRAVVINDGKILDPEYIFVLKKKI